MDKQILFNKKVLKSDSTGDELEFDGYNILRENVDTVEYADLPIVNTLSTTDPASGSILLDFDSTGAYKFGLNNDASITTIGEIVDTEKEMKILFSATSGDVTISFDPTWYWFESRPGSDQVVLTDGTMAELTLRSYGTDIIASYTLVV